MDAMMCLKKLFQKRKTRPQETETEPLRQDIDKGQKPMYLIAGLGNPDKKYENTRHNVGFMTIDTLAEKLGVAVTTRKFKAFCGQGMIGSEKVLLMKPQTFMNLSGEAVQQAVRFYKISPEHVIVVSDEVSLPVGKIRIRRSGSAGGHNGLKNIIQNLGTDNFPRIRMGVGAAPHPDYDMADWVLGTFKNQDAEDMAEAAKKVSSAVQSYIVDGPDKAMNRFNQR